MSVVDLICGVFNMFMLRCKNKPSISGFHPSIHMLTSTHFYVIKTLQNFNRSSSCKPIVVVKLPMAYRLQQVLKFKKPPFCAKIVIGGFVLQKLM